MLEHCIDSVKLLAEIDARRLTAKRGLLLASDQRGEMDYIRALSLLSTAPIIDLIFEYQIYKRKVKGRLWDDPTCRRMVQTCV